MQLTTIGVLYRKEMTEAIRDWRALIFAVLIPIFMGPAIMLAMGIGSKISARRVHNEVHQIVIINADEAPALMDLIRADNHLNIVSVPENMSYMELVGSKKVQAVLEFPVNFQKDIQTGIKQQVIPIYYYEGEWRSESAMQKVQQIIRDYRDQWVGSKLSALGISGKTLSPFETHPQNVVESSKVAGQNVSGLISFLIVLYCFMGTIGPAIEQTIAQKERGFIESVLARPVKRIDIAIAKFLVVFTTAVTTAVVSIISIILALRIQRLYTPGDAAHYLLTPAGIAMCVCAMIPLAILFSSITLALALQAKSSREANAYLSPLLGIAGLPALIAMLPGSELTLKTSLIPVLNLSLGIKEILSGSFPFFFLTLAVVSSCLYAAVAIIWAASVFNREFTIFR